MTLPAANGQLPTGIFHVTTVMGMSCGANCPPPAPMLLSRLSRTSPAIRDRRIPMASHVEPLKPRPANVSDIDNNDAAGAFLKHTHNMRRGASWFLWIGLLSVVNSILMFTDGGRFFIAGLGVNLVVDTAAKRMQSGGILADAIINGIVVLAFVGIWTQARK